MSEAKTWLSRRRGAHGGLSKADFLGTILAFISIWISSVPLWLCERITTDIGATTCRKGAAACPARATVCPARATTFATKAATSASGATARLTKATTCRPRQRLWRLAPLEQRLVQPEQRLAPLEQRLAHPEQRLARLELRLTPLQQLQWPLYPRRGHYDSGGGNNLGFDRHTPATRALRSPRLGSPVRVAGPLLRPQLPWCWA